MYHIWWVFSKTWIIITCQLLYSKCMFDQFYLQIVHQVAAEGWRWGEGGRQKVKVLPVIYLDRVAYALLKYYIEMLFLSFDSWYKIVAMYMWSGWEIFDILLHFLLWKGSKIEFSLKCFLLLLSILSMEIKIPLFWRTNKTNRWYKFFLLRLKF